MNSFSKKVGIATIVVSLSASQAFGGGIRYGSFHRGFIKRNFSSHRLTTKSRRSHHIKHHRRYYRGYYRTPRVVKYSSSYYNQNITIIIHNSGPQAKKEEPKRTYRQRPIERVRPLDDAKNIILIRGTSVVNTGIPAN